MIVLDLSILNQKGTPMFNSDLTVNRPAAGIVGRIFIATDAPFGIFRDTGTGWDQVSSAGGGATIYSGDGTLTGNRTVSSGGFNLTFTPQTTFLTSLIPSTSGSSYSVLGSNTLTYAAGFSSSNIGNVYSANGAINAQRFSGSATFAQANLASAMVSVNSVDFTAPGSTITMTQSTGIRAMTGHQSQFQYQGTNSGTISHAAVSQNLGFYRPPAATGILTITNAYGHLINALDDYGAGFTFINRWGIYQAGASDTNFFAGAILANGQYTNISTNNFTTAPIALRTSAADVPGFSIYKSSFGHTNSIQFLSNDTTNRFSIGQGFIGNGTTVDFTIARFVSSTWSESFRIFNSTGNVGINTNIDAGYKCDIFGNTRIYPRGNLNGGFEFTFNDVYNLLHSNSLTFISSNNALFIGGITYTMLGINKNETQSQILIGYASFQGALSSPSAKVDIRSSTQGFLGPRMTNAQILAIVSPAEGLQVFNTTQSVMCCYQAGAWVKFSHSPM